MVTVGTTVTRTATQAGVKPRWMQFINSTTLEGDAELPSGVRRIVTLNGAVRSDEFITVDPVALPADTVSPWRCIIYAPNGDYLLMDGGRGYPTIGTPTVRLSSTAPSKAVLHLPLMQGSDNARLPTFNRWTGTYTGMVKRGMEVTVEYRDEDTGTLTLCFRGRIFQISSGEDIEITAYDRIMDLVQYSDQYQPNMGTLSTGSARYIMNVPGGQQLYLFNGVIGSVVETYPQNTMRISSLDEQTQYLVQHSTLVDWGITPYETIILHNAPAVSGHSSSDKTVLRVRAKIRVTVNPAGVGHTYKFCVLVGDGQSTWTFKSDSYTADASGTSDKVLECQIPEAYMHNSIGAYIEYTDNRDHIMFYWLGTTNHVTATTYFTKPIAGGSWASRSTADHPLPEFSVDYVDDPLTQNMPITTSISGDTTYVYADPAAIPSIPNTTYTQTVFKGYRLIITYYPADSIAISDVIADLLKNAGLMPDIPVGQDIGSTAYYTTSTYDYMTCILELLRAYDLSLKDSLTEAGTILVRAIHTSAESPIKVLTIVPGNPGEQIIVSHNLTAHWMAEKATLAYITPNATDSGLALALETDDQLLDHSLVDILQSPLRSVLSDNTLGSHAMIASAASGKVAEVHTNELEGTLALAGYRLSLWDFTDNAIGGVPVTVDIPEYGPATVTVPTEMVLGDGITTLSLDNIRRADRNELSNSMGKSDDAVANASEALPNMVYIFSRGPSGPSGSLTAVALLDENGTELSAQTVTAYLKTVSDQVGYIHYCAMFRPTVGVSYAPTAAASIKLTIGGTDYLAVIDNPKIAINGQGVHIDVRCPV